MFSNPVFVNELRKSLFRRKPLVCFGVWAAAFASIVWIVDAVPGAGGQLFEAFPRLALCVVAPAFASGAFAKEREQRTWTDLVLTRLTTGQLLTGKFLAAWLPVMAVLFSLIPPVALGALRSEFSPYGSSAPWWEPAPSLIDERFFGKGFTLALRCIPESACYILVAMVCSHYCRRARAALTVAYVALAGYAVAGAMLLDSILPGYSARSLSGGYRGDNFLGGYAESMHFITCVVITGGFWVLLSVGLKFEPE